MENYIKKRIPPWSENIEKYRISTEYTVISYTTPHYLIFRYYSNSETYMCETRKSIVLWWISSEEKEKLLAFEMKRKEKFKGLKAYDGTTAEGLWKKLWNGEQYKRKIVLNTDWGWLGMVKWHIYACGGCFAVSFARHAELPPASVNIFSFFWLSFFFQKKVT